MLLRAFNSQTNYGVESVAEIVDAFAKLPDSLQRIREDSSRRERIKLQPSVDGSLRQRVLQPLAKFVQPGSQLDAMRHDQFAGFAGSQRSPVGDQVSNGDIDLVPDGADYGNPTIRDLSGDDFFIERPKVFQTPTAATRDDNIDVGNQMNDA